MATLYIRDVPEHVAEALKARAAAQAQSLSAYLNAQLATIATRPSNAEITARLRTHERAGGVGAQRIIEEIRAARR